MKLNDLLKKRAVGIGAEAESPCEYLSTRGVDFDKTMKADNTGAFFIFKDDETAEKYYYELVQHENISAYLNMKLNDNAVEVSHK